ncbi:MAG: hypothetical protein AM1032_000343 [Mycoplasmataceae bacterium]|nr:MAG: hypothetical protein AM1032_000343 [Mycoplasmataceae bacterium]
MVNNYSITILTDDQEEEFFEFLENEFKNKNGSKNELNSLMSRAESLIENLKEGVKPGKSFLEDGENLDNLKKPIEDSFLDRIITAFTEVGARKTIREWIKYEKELLSNLPKIAVQAIENAEDIEINDFLPFISESSIGKIDYSKITSLQSIVRSKGIKIKGSFNPQIGSSIIVTPEEKKAEKIILPSPILEKTISFLRSKSIFINSRAETINGLKELYNIWNNSEWKVEIASESGNAVNSLNSLSLTLGIPSMIKDLIKSGSAFSKFRFIEKNNKDFQIIIGDNSEDLELMKKTYNDLYQLVENDDSLNILNLKEENIEENLQLFENDYLIYDILSERNGVWKGKNHLKITELDEAVKTLIINLKELRSERDKQFNQFEINSNLKELIIEELKIINEIRNLKKKSANIKHFIENGIENKSFSSLSKEKNKKRLELLNKIVDSQFSLISRGISQKELLDLFNKEEIKKNIEEMWSIEEKIDALESKLTELENSQSLQISCIIQQI